MGVHMPYLITVLSARDWMIKLMFNIPLDTNQVIPGTLFPANLLTSIEKKVKNQEMQNTKPRPT